MHIYAYVYMLHMHVTRHKKSYGYAMLCYGIGSACHVYARHATLSRHYHHPCGGRWGRCRQGSGRHEDEEEIGYMIGIIFVDERRKRYVMLYIQRHE